MRNEMTFLTTARALSFCVTFIPVVVVSANAHAQVPPGEGYKETPKERTVYQALIDRTGPDCPSLQDRLYAKRSRCIARFGLGAKTGRDFSESLCSNIDIRMRACGVPIPKLTKAPAPAELRAQERAQHGEAHKP